MLSEVFSFSRRASVAVINGVEARVEARKTAYNGCSACLNASNGSSYARLDAEESTTVFVIKRSQRHKEKKKTLRLCASVASL
jgi:hypothetical protein